MTDDTIRVTLLGTGAPPPSMQRFGPSTLVEAGEEKLLFDAGRGALLRLAQLDPPVRQVRNVFLTHLHSDHTVGLPDVWLTGWLNGRAATPLRVRGPRGTKKMMEYLDLAFQYDIRIRLYDDRLQPEGVVIDAEDIAEGIVYENNGVTVTAIEVDHAPIYPAFGYRIVYRGRTVVLSGDTRYSEHFIDKAKGADLVVYEVIAADMIRSRLQGNDEAAENVINHHTTPEQAGEVFTRLKTKLAVYSHIVPIEASPEDLVTATRKTYSGPLEVGEDLMRIHVGDEITVRKSGTAA